MGTSIQKRIAALLLSVAMALSLLPNLGAGVQIAHADTMNCPVCEANGQTVTLTEFNTGNGFGWGFQEDGTFHAWYTGTNDWAFGAIKTDWLKREKFTGTVVVCSGGPALAADAFNNNLGKITSVSLPANMKNIKANAFANLPNLQSVTIGGTPIEHVSGLTINANAFSGTTGTNSKEFQATLTELKKTYTNLNLSFPVKLPDMTCDGDKCTESLTDVYEQDNFRVGKVNNGSRYDVHVWLKPGHSHTSLNRTIRYYIGNAGVEAHEGYGSEDFSGKIVVHEGFTAVGWEALYQTGSSRLREIELPATVNTIGGKAFYVSSLEKITFAEGSQLKNIGDLGLAGTRLTSVTLPNGLTSIGSRSFWGASLKEVTIPDTVTEIGSQAFYNNNIQELTIPNSVTSIGDNAFYNNNIQELTIPNSVTSIGNGAFQGNNLTSVTLGTGVTSIGNSAFQGNSLSSVTIPNNVTSIGNSAFQGNQLTSVTLGTGVTSIGNSAFQGNNLTEITIPNNVTSMGNNAFGAQRGDAEWENITIGANSQLQVNNNDSNSPFGGNFGDEAKKSLGALQEKVPDILLPFPVEKKDTTTCPDGCGATLSAVYQESNLMIGIEQNSDKEKNGTIHVWLKNKRSNTNVGQSLRKYVGENPRINVRKSDEAQLTPPLGFGEGSGNNGKLILHEGITQIDGEAFDRTSGLTSITMPNSLTTIGQWAFASIPTLEEINFPQDATSLTSFGGNIFNYDIGYDINDPDDPDRPHPKKIKWPETWPDADGLKNIPNNMFKGNWLVMNTLHDQVTRVGANAFQNCVFISDDPKLPAETVVTSFTIPNAVTTIESNAFRNCRLEKLTIGTGVTTIGNEAFRDNKLTTVTIPNNVTELGTYAFAWNKLTGITLSDKVTELKEGVFRGNELTTYEIPSQVTAIRSYALAGNQLTAINVPKTVTEIGRAVFSNQTNHELTEDQEGYGQSVLATITFNGKDGYSAEDQKFDKAADIGPQEIADTNANITGLDRLAFEGSYGEGATKTIAALQKLFNKLSFTTEVPMDARECPGCTDGTMLTSVYRQGDFYIGIDAQNQTHVWSALYEPVNGASTTPAGTEVELNREALAYLGSDVYINYGHDSKSKVEPKEGFGGAEGILIVHEGITQIGHAAYDRTEGLTEVRLPASLKKIREYGFSTTPDLAKVEFATKTDGTSDLRVIEKDAFRFDDTVHSAKFYPEGTIPAALIPEKKEIKLPNGLEVIGPGAFKNSGLTSIDIPNTVNTIGDGAFGTLIYGEDATTAKTEGNRKIGILNTITFDGGKSFDPAASELKQVAMNAGTLSRGVYQPGLHVFAFEGQFGSDAEDTLGTIETAFANSTVKFRPDRKRTLDTTLGGTNKPTGITFVDIVDPGYDNNTNNVWAGIDNKGTLHIWLKDGSTPNQDGKAYYKANRVVSKMLMTPGAPGAYYKDNAKIKLNGEVVFHDGIQGIGSNAFYYGYGVSSFNTRNVKKVTFPSSLKAIDAWAFAASSVTDTYGASVPGTSELTIIEFANNQSGLETIGRYAFYGSKLPSFEVPKSVTTIDAWAFGDCPDLKTLTFETGSKITTIGDSAFRAIPATEVKIPDSVTTIGTEAFASRSGEGSTLKKVWIAGNNVTIGPRAFGYLPTLEILYYDGIVDENVLTGSDKAVVISDNPNANPFTVTPIISTALYEPAKGVELTEVSEGNKYTDPDNGKTYLTSATSVVGGNTVRNSLSGKMLVSTRLRMGFTPNKDYTMTISKLTGGNVTGTALKTATESAKRNEATTLSFVVSNDDFAQDGYGAGTYRIKVEEVGSMGANAKSASKDIHIVETKVVVDFGKKFMLTEDGDFDRERFGSYETLYNDLKQPVIANRTTYKNLITPQNAKTEIATAKGNGLFGGNDKDNQSYKESLIIGEKHKITVEGKEVTIDGITDATMRYKNQDKDKGTADEYLKQFKELANAQFTIDGTTEVVLPELLSVGQSWAMNGWYVAGSDTVRTTGDSVTLTAPRRTTTTTSGLATIRETKSDDTIYLIPAWKANTQVERFAYKNLRNQRLGYGTEKTIPFGYDPKGEVDKTVNPPKYSSKFWGVDKTANEDRFDAISTSTWSSGNDNYTTQVYTSKLEEIQKKLAKNEAVTDGDRTVTSVTDFNTGANDFSVDLWLRRWDGIDVKIYLKEGRNDRVMLPVMSADGKTTITASPDTVPDGWYVTKLEPAQLKYADYTDDNAPQRGKMVIHFPMKRNMRYDLEVVITDLSDPTNVGTYYQTFTRAGLKENAGEELWPKGLGSMAVFANNTFLKREDKVDSNKEYERIYYYTLPRGNKRNQLLAAATASSNDDKILMKPVTFGANTMLQNNGPDAGITQLQQIVVSGASLLNSDQFGVKFYTKTEWQNEINNPTWEDMEKDKDADTKYFFYKDANGRHQPWSTASNDIRQDENNKLARNVSSALIGTQVQYPDNISDADMETQEKKVTTFEFITVDKTSNYNPENADAVLPNDAVKGQIQLYHPSSDRRLKVMRIVGDASLGTQSLDLYNAENSNHPINKQLDNVLLNWYGVNKDGATNDQIARAAMSAATQKDTIFEIQVPDYVSAVASASVYAEMTTEQKANHTALKLEGYDKANDTNSGHPGNKGTKISVPGSSGGIYRLSDDAEQVAGVIITAEDGSEAVYYAKIVKVAVKDTPKLASVTITAESNAAQVPVPVTKDNNGSWAASVKSGTSYAVALTGAEVQPTEGSDKVLSEIRSVSKDGVEIPPAGDGTYLVEIGEYPVTLEVIVQLPGGTMTSTETITLTPTITETYGLQSITVNSTAATKVTDDSYSAAVKIGEAESATISFALTPMDNTKIESVSGGIATSMTPDAEANTVTFSESLSAGTYYYTISVASKNDPSNTKDITLTVEVTTDEPEEPTPDDTDKTVTVPGGGKIEVGGGTDPVTDKDKDPTNPTIKPGEDKDGDGKPDDYTVDYQPGDGTDKPEIKVPEGSTITDKEGNPITDENGKPIVDDKGNIDTEKLPDGTDQIIVTPPGGGDDIVIKFNPPIGTTDTKVTPEVGVSISVSGGNNATIASTGTNAYKVTQDAPAGNPTITVTTKDNAKVTFNLSGDKTVESNKLETRTLTNDADKASITVTIGQETYTITFSPEVPGGTTSVNIPGSDNGTIEVGNKNENGDPDPANPDPTNPTVKPTPNPDDPTKPGDGSDVTVEYEPGTKTDEDGKPVIDENGDPVPNTPVIKVPQGATVTAVIPEPANETITVDENGKVDTSKLPIGTTAIKIQVPVTDVSKATTQAAQAAQAVTDAVSKLTPKPETETTPEEVLAPEDGTASEDGTSADNGADAATGDAVDNSTDTPADDAADNNGGTTDKVDDTADTTGNTTDKVDDTTDTTGNTTDKVDDTADTTGNTTDKVDDTTDKVDDTADTTDNTTDKTDDAADKTDEVIEKTNGTTEYKEVIIRFNPPIGSTETKIALPKGGSVAVSDGARIAIDNNGNYVVTYSGEQPKVTLTGIEGAPTATVKPADAVTGNVQIDTAKIMPKVSSFAINIPHSYTDELFTVGTSILFNPVIGTNPEKKEDPTGAELKPVTGTDGKPKDDEFVVDYKPTPEGDKPVVTIPGATDVTDKDGKPIEDIVDGKGNIDTSKLPDGTTEITVTVPDGNGTKDVTIKFNPPIGSTDKEIKLPGGSIAVGDKNDNTDKTTITPSKDSTGNEYNVTGGGKEPSITLTPNKNSGGQNPTITIGGTDYSDAVKDDGTIDWSKIPEGTGQITVKLPTDPEKTIVLNFDPKVGTKPSTPTTPTNPGGGGGGGAVTPPTTTTPADPSNPSADAAGKVDGNGTLNVGKGDTDSAMKDLVNWAQTGQDGKKPDNVTLVVKPPEGNTSNINNANVTIGKDHIANLGDKTDASLTVQTPNGNVTLGNDTLSQLGKGDGDVSVSLNKGDGGTMTLEVKKGDTVVEKTPESILLEIPGSYNSGHVVIVTENGKDRILRKSHAIGDVMKVRLDGSATFRIENRARSFGDVPSTHWAKEAIDSVTARELFLGVSATEFAPSMTMSRSMLVTVLHRLEDTPAGGASSFGDITSGTWYTDAVAWASANGIVQGTSATTFSPDDNVTREQIALFLYRYAKLVGHPTTASGNLNTFSDGAATSDWAREAMNWAVGAGLLQGDDQGALRPTDSATRAEVAVMMMRFCKMLLAA